MQKIFSLLQLENGIYLICTGTGSRTMLPSCKGNVWKCLSIKNWLYFLLLSLALKDTQWILTLQVVLEFLGFLERELKQVIPSLQNIGNYTRGQLFPKVPRGYENKGRSTAITEPDISSGLQCLLGSSHLFKEVKHKRQTHHRGMDSVPKTWLLIMQPFLFLLFFSGLKAKETLFKWAGAATPQN